MLWTLCIILLVLWGVGIGVILYLTGGLIHILLVIALPVTLSVCFRGGGFQAKVGCLRSAPDRP